VRRTTLTDVARRAGVSRMRRRRILLARRRDGSNAADAAGAELARTAESIGVATAGKLGGTMVSARLTGLNWSNAFALGALMNTRGLVELVALNIGYDLGILPPSIFAMMVLMALVTTFLTGPLLDLAEYVRRRRVAAIAVP